MSRKDFVLIAKTINSIEDELSNAGEISQAAYQTIALRFAAALASTNPNFNRQRFIDACQTGK